MKGAAKYEVQLSTSDTFATKWRVSAYDSSGTSGLLGQSPWRAFRFDSTVPTLVGHTPTRTATRTANFVATFSEPVRGVGSTTMASFSAGNVRRLSAHVTINQKGTVATLNPADPLRLGKTYTVKLLSGITDLAGNALTPTSWTVTVS